MKHPNLAHPNLAQHPILVHPNLAQHPNLVHPNLSPLLGFLRLHLNSVNNTEVASVIKMCVHQYPGRFLVF